MQGIFSSGEYGQEQGKRASTDPEFAIAFDLRRSRLHQAMINKENAIARYQVHEQRIETVVREHLDHKTMIDDLAQTPHTHGPSLPPKMVYIDQNPDQDTLLSADPADLAREKINQAVMGVEPAPIQVNPDISFNPSTSSTQRMDSVQRSI